MVIIANVIWYNAAMADIYQIRGIVQEGKKRGKDLGFPTANIALTGDIEEGIYISKTKVGRTWMPSVTFIGSAETFGEHDRKAETYILDIDKNLYGTTIVVTLLEKIRDSKAFSSVDELIRQMHDDVSKTKEYFGI